MTNQSERKSIPQSLAPGFIAAMPQLEDPNFRRSVVLLLRHGDEGAFGLIINREADVTVAELCASLGIVYSGEAGAPMMIGGPVQAEGILVLNGGEACLDVDDEDEMEIVEDVRLVTARKGLELLAEKGSPAFRCYAGYAGWGPGQLEAELEEGAWVPLLTDASLVFAENAERVWEAALRRAGIDPLSLTPGGELA